MPDSHMLFLDPLAPPLKWPLSAGIALDPHSGKRLAGFSDAQQWARGMVQATSASRRLASSIVVLACLRGCGCALGGERPERAHWARARNRKRWRWRCRPTSTRMTPATRAVTRNSPAVHGSACHALLGCSPSHLLSLSRLPAADYAKRNALLATLGAVLRQRAQQDRRPRVGSCFLLGALMASAAPAPGPRDTRGRGLGNRRHALPARHPPS